MLIAALTHAIWHGLLKSQGDLLQTIASVYGACALVCLAAVAFVAPPNIEVLALIALSVALHCGSYVYIAHCYEHSDLSYAFPLYRGLAPILVALSAWALLGERPGTVALAGLALAAGGVASLAFEHGARWRGGNSLVVQLLLSAAFVAAYTVVDAMGVRRAATPFSYVVWLFLFNGPAIMAIAWWVRRRRHQPRKPVPRVRLLIASSLALLAHGLVIWALSAGAVATVAALRETSVIFAAIIGSTLLREPFGRYRIAASVCVAVGVMMLHIAS